MSGLDKAQAVQVVLEGASQPRQYPAQIINPAQGDVVWLLDRAAASQLKKTSVTKWTRVEGW